MSCIEGSVTAVTIELAAGHRAELSSNETIEIRSPEKNFDCLDRNRGQIRCIACCHCRPIFHFLLGLGAKESSRSGRHWYFPMLNPVNEMVCPR